jgi:hypothetical protein
VRLSDAQTDILLDYEKKFLKQALNAGFKAQPDLPLEHGPGVTRPGQSCFFLPAIHLLLRLPFTALYG